MKRLSLIWLVVMLFLGNAGSVRAETALERIDKSGTLTIGTRRGSPPFAYVNQGNEWVGFSIDLVEKEIGRAHV